MMRRVSRAINSSLLMKMCQSDPSRNATNPAGELAISPTLLFFKKQAAGNKKLGGGTLLSLQGARLMLPQIL
jgi:hypothetical protein